MKIDVKIDKPFNEISDLPRYEVHMEYIHEYIAQKYLISWFKSAQKSKDKTMLN